MICILLSGKAESGKDTFLQITSQRFYDLAVDRIAFADKLKEFAAMMGWDGKKDERGGEFLQQLGSAVRQYNEDFWVLATIPKLQAYSQVCDIICFTDCRYPNEIERIKSLDWIVGKVVTVRVDRPGHISNRPDHISETALDDYDFDYRIVNDGTLEDYRQKVVALVNQILEGER